MECYFQKESIDLLLANAAIANAMLDVKQNSSRDPRSLSVAVASSGLGHVRRGIEAWAQDLAKALRRRKISVSLFAAGPVPDAIALKCLTRNSFGAIALSKMFRHVGGWRYGLGSSYEVEATTFSFLLWRYVRREFDILHVQDPLVGIILDRLHRLGLSSARVIVANGTGENAATLCRLSAIQHLTPQAAREWTPLRPPNQSVFAIPNFVDVSVFAPGDRRMARQRFGFPNDAFIVLSCAAIRRVHKRVDYLIREFSKFSRDYRGPLSLVVAGGREEDTDEIMALGRDLLGDRVRFLINIPRSDMPDLYRTADVYVHPSLFEMGSIGLLEAMATGLPIICNHHEGFRFHVGPAGVFEDLSAEGAIANALASMCFPERLQQLGSAARAQVCAHFSEDVVIGQILDMYRSVASGEIRATVG